MSPPPRRLTFVVGNSLLTASLALTVGACKKGPTVNTAAPEEPHVNEGPEEGEATEEIVNEGPEADPADEDGAEDVGGDGDAAPEEAPDGPNVNTVPDGSV